MFMSSGGKKEMQEFQFDYRGSDSDRTYEKRDMRALNRLERLQEERELREATGEVWDEEEDF